MRCGPLLPALLLAGCNLADRETERSGGNEQARLDQKREDRLRSACASQATFNGLKEVAFDEAARIRGSGTAALDQLAAAAIVRMEQPRVVSRDDSLNVTVCAGRFVLELPPGAENAFDGQRRVQANVEYAAQDAPDGSGLIFQMEGAEPIIYRLATIGGMAQARAQPPAVPQATAVPAAPPPPARRQIAEAPQERRPAALPTPPPPAAPAARQPQASGAARPSFNCRSARTATERMVCGSARLAAQDRRMAALYYAQMANGDGQVRQRLRQSRDRFLARRERCGSEACVASVYAERVEEIRAITAGD